MSSSPVSILIPLSEGVYDHVMFCSATGGSSLVMVKPTVMSEGLPSLVSTPMGSLSTGVTVGGTEKERETIKTRFYNHLLSH